jgi:hypothetical protein
LQLDDFMFYPANSGITNLELDLVAKKYQQCDLCRVRQSKTHSTKQIIGIQPNLDLMNRLGLARFVNYNREFVASKFVKVVIMHFWD